MQLNNELLVLQYDPVTRQMAVKQILSTIPGDAAQKKGCYASHILLSADQQRIYVANRKHDSISLFQLGENGEWRLAQNLSTGGSWPRFIQFAPGENYILIANQLENNIRAAAVDKKTGKLALLEPKMETFQPAFIQFLC